QAASAASLHAKRSWASSTARRTAPALLRRPKLREEFTGRAEGRKGRGAGSHEPTQIPFRPPALPVNSSLSLFDAGVRRFRRGLVGLILEGVGQAVARVVDGLGVVRCRVEAGPRGRV